jgi:hypothetical protein
MRRGQAIEAVGLNATTRRMAMTSNWRQTARRRRFAVLPTRNILLVLALLMVASVIAAPAASARTSRPYQSSFGSFPFNSPGVIAVDQASGDVYAVTRNEKQTVIVRFTAAGTPHDFTAGPGAGTNTLFSFSSTGVSGIAVDNSGGPLNGAIYVTDKDSRTVKVFASTGAPLGAIAGTGSPHGHFSVYLHGVAVDSSNGVVYISETQDGFQSIAHIWRYAPTSPAGAIDDSDYSLTGLTSRSADEPEDLAAASEGVYVREAHPDLHSDLVRYPASAFTSDFSNTPTPTTIDTGTQSLGVVGVAADPKTGEIYANEGDRIAVFDSAGSLLYKFGAAAYLGSGLSGFFDKGIAIRSAVSGPAPVAYVADPGSGEIDVFGSPEKVATLTRPDLGAFGPDGTAASSFSANGPGLLALGQADRRLYATEPGAPGIFGFDVSSPPGHVPLSGFTPLAAPVGSFGSQPAVDSTALGSAGNLYLASRETNLLYGWSSSGSALGGAFPVDPAATPGSPAGAPKELCGAAVDSAGNVWVANHATEKILKYSSAGVSVAGTIDTSAQGPPCGLAFDSDDNLYVGINDGYAVHGIWKYTAASGYSSALEITNHGGSFAIDPSAERLFSVSLRWVDEYDLAGNLLDEFTVPADSFSGVSVDATSHQLYVSDEANHKIHVFGPGVLLPEVAPRPVSGLTNTSATLSGTVVTQGVGLDDCHFEYVTLAAFRSGGFSDLSSGGSLPCSPTAGSIPLDLDEHAVSANATGLTVSTAYRFRLAAANGNGSASSTDTPFTTAGPPLVETVGAPIRTTSTARLEGRVDPSRSAATYHFEYGDQGPCDANPCQVTESHPVGSGDEYRFVSQLVQGLAPDTTYHYRLIADNGNTSGPAAGADMTVTTRASDAPLSHGHFAGPPGSDRAWEQVSIADSGGNPVAATYAVSDNGDRALYQVFGGTPISSVGTAFNLLFAQRSETGPHQGGWGSENPGPAREQLLGGGWFEPGGRADLSDQIAVNAATGRPGRAYWRVRPGQPPAKVFETNATGTQTIVSEDASRLLVMLPGSPDPAHPAAPATVNVYDVSSGTPHLVDLLPDGSVPACGVTQPGGGESTLRAQRRVSPDGSLFFFESCTGLYMRNLVGEQSKLIAPGFTRFLKSTSNAAFFTSEQSLVPGDGGGRDVYRYDLAAETLKCVTCVAALNAEVDSQAIAVAPDGSRVYFKTQAALLPGAATPGLYRVDVSSGDLAYVAPSSGGSFGEEAGGGNAITPDGSVLIFASADPRLDVLGGQRNGGDVQFYRYDDRDRSLTCASCPSDGSEPRGPVTSDLAAGAPRAGANRTALSADGATFAFGTPTRLVTADQNTAPGGQGPWAGTDLYEWRDGRLLLVSDGLTNWPNDQEVPTVGAISPSGRDIFFDEAAQLTPDVPDAYRRLYDARIGGGFEFTPPPKPCPLEVCQGTPKGAPEELAPGSQSISGPGNAQPRAPHKKKHHKKKHHKKKHHKKKHAPKKSQSKAKHNRRAAR